MNELLLKIDDIQTAATEAEDAVYESLIESYDKMLVLMEYAEDDDLSAFGIFQEATTDGSKTIRKTNIIAKLVRFIKQMCQRIVIKLSQFKLNRTAKAIVKRYNVPDDTPIIPVPLNDEFFNDFKNDTEKQQEFLNKIDKNFVFNDIFIDQVYAGLFQNNFDGSWSSSLSTMKDGIAYLENDLQNAKNGHPPNPNYFKLVTKGQFIHSIAEMQQNFDASIKVVKKINAVVDTITHDDLDQYGDTHDVLDMGKQTISKERMIRAIDKYVSDMYKHIMLKIRWMSLYLQLISYVNNNDVPDNPDFDDDINDIMREPGVEKTSDDNDQISEDGLTPTIRKWIKEKNGDELRKLICFQLYADPQATGIVKDIMLACKQPNKWLFEPYQNGKYVESIPTNPTKDMTEDDWNQIMLDLKENFSSKRYNLVVKLARKLNKT